MHPSLHEDHEQLLAPSTYPLLTTSQSTGAEEKSDMMVARAGSTIKGTKNKRAEKEHMATTENVKVE